MKQGTTAPLAAVLLLAAVGAAHAQLLPPIGEPPPHYASRAPDPAMPSHEVTDILRSRGFLPMGGPVKRGEYYIVRAMHQSGEQGRVVINAFSGRFIEFVPASQVAAAPPPGRDAMVLVYQGPTFPPRDLGRAVPPPPPVSRALPPPPSARGVPRPPASIPRIATRTPAVAPKPRPQAAPQRPDSAQAPPVPAPVESRPAATSPPLAPRPLEQVLPPPKVQPTRPLPPVQTLE
jgi:hypothetical protein